MVPWLKHPTFPELGRRFKFPGELRAHHKRKRRKSIIWLNPLTSSTLCYCQYDSYYRHNRPQIYFSTISAKKNILKKTKIHLGEHGMSGWEKNVLLHGIFFSSLEREDRSLRLHMCLYKNSDLWEKDQEMNETQLVTCSIHLLWSHCQ